VSRPFSLAYKKEMVERMTARTRSALGRSRPRPGDADDDRPLANGGAWLAVDAPRMREAKGSSVEEEVRIHADGRSSRDASFRPTSSGRASCCPQL
jgi:hypothetical protein